MVAMGVEAEDGEGVEVVDEWEGLCFGLKEEDDGDSPDWKRQEVMSSASADPFLWGRSGGCGYSAHVSHVAHSTRVVRGRSK